MQRIKTSERGVTLIEMLVVLAVLSLVLAGIYGLLNSAYQSYNHNRAKLESQQTARIVMDYLVYRLREIDGGSYTNEPENCIYCHSGNMDQMARNDPFMPCTTDVMVPQKSPLILDYKKAALPALPTSDIPLVFQSMTGNYIQFQADLLPLNGFNESFTDSPSGPTANGEWDWTANDPAWDLDLDGKYDRGEPELLEDLNDNGQHDYFGETWTFELQQSSDGPYFELVESLNFTSLRPKDRSFNKSVYDNSGYEKVVVAYGITGLRIEKVDRIPPGVTYPTGREVSKSCMDPGGNATACHGSGNTATGPMFNRTLNVYGNATSMVFSQFLVTHPWWNIRGLSVEVVTTDTKGNYQQFTRLREFVNFRNLEINQ